MINTKLTARLNGNIALYTADGECVATFATDAIFYIVTGFKTVEAYNEYQAEQPTKFLVWERKH